MSLPPVGLNGLENKGMDVSGGHSATERSGVSLQMLTGPFPNKHQIDFVKHRVTQLPRCSSV